MGGAGAAQRGGAASDMAAWVGGAAWVHVGLLCSWVVQYQDIACPVLTPAAGDTPLAGSSAWGCTVGVGWVDVGGAG